MWEAWHKYLARRKAEALRSRPRYTYAVRVAQRFALDGRSKAVEVNIVADRGRAWINVTAAKPFGLQSSAWLGRAGSKSRHRRKQGLKRQTEKRLRSAEQNRGGLRPPRVIVHFTQGVTCEVAQALIEMGAHVEGTIVSPPRRK